MTRFYEKFDSFYTSCIRIPQIIFSSPEDSSGMMGRYCPVFIVAHHQSNCDDYQSNEQWKTIYSPSWEDKMAVVPTFCHVFSVLHIFHISKGFIHIMPNSFTYINIHIHVYKDKNTRFCMPRWWWLPIWEKCVCPQGFAFPFLVFSVSCLWTFLLCYLFLSESEDFFSLVHE